MSDKRKLFGMILNVGDFDNDGFVDIYVMEWFLYILGKVQFDKFFIVGKLYSVKVC